MVMTHSNMFTSKVTNIEVISDTHNRVTFSSGSKHMMSNNNSFNVGDIIAIDSHGSVWIKQ